MMLKAQGCLWLRGRCCLREAMIPRLAPTAQQLILCFIAEQVLGEPKSY